MPSRWPMTSTPFPNQPPPYEGRNLYDTDTVIRQAVIREGAAYAIGALGAWGAELGRAETFALADAANRHPPASTPSRSIPRGIP